MSTLDNDEWEAINDNGFVYKRKKLRTGLLSIARASDPQPEPYPDPAILLNKRHSLLLQVKNKYQSELALWDHLSNSFNDFEARVKSQLEEGPLHGPCNMGSQSVEVCNGSLVQDLLFKVEAQEAIIRNFEQLCDEVDSFCDAQEEKAKQGFFNLPIWNSPRELMASLCKD